MSSSSPSSDTYGSITFTSAPERRISVIHGAGENIGFERGERFVVHRSRPSDASTTASTIDTPSSALSLEMDTDMMLDDYVTHSDVPAEEDYAYPLPRQTQSASASLAAILGNFEVEAPKVATSHPAAESSVFTSPFINHEPGFDAGGGGDADIDLFETHSASSLPSFASASRCSTLDMDQDGTESVTSVMSSVVSEEQVNVVQSAINKMDLHSRLGIMESLRRLSQGKEASGGYDTHRSSDTWVREHMLKDAAGTDEPPAAVDEPIKAKPDSSTPMFVGFSQPIEPKKKQKQVRRGPYIFTE